MGWLHEYWAAGNTTFYAGAGIVVKGCGQDAVIEDTLVHDVKGAIML
jgi:hypothetical protein